MIDDGSLDTRQIKILVLDEVDVMLSRGFEEQVKQIFLQLPEHGLQVITVTATLPPDVLRVSIYAMTCLACMRFFLNFQITERFMKNALHVLIKEEDVPLEAIRQFYVDVERDEYKFDTLCDIYGSLSIDQSIIFCNTCRKVHQSYHAVTYAIIILYVVLITHNYKTKLSNKQMSITNFSYFFGMHWQF